jgi:hypothetical protein
MTEGIAHDGNALAPELILESHDHGRSGSDCTLKGLIDAGDMQMDRDSRATQRARPTHAPGDIESVARIRSFRFGY